MNSRLSYLRLSAALVAILLLAGATSGAKEAGSKGTIVGRVESRELDETSGLAASRLNENVVWLHNDGPIRRLVAVKTTGETVATLEFSSPTTDVEDIAIGPGPDTNVDYLYVGDIGDNDKRRKTVRVLRIPEPNLSGVQRQRVQADQVEVFELAYPDTPFDAEALLVDSRTGDIFVATKEKNRCRVFVAAASELNTNETIPLRVVLNLKVGEVSGGDISRNGASIVLRSEADGWLWARTATQSIAQAFATQVPSKCKVRSKAQDRNGEAIGFHPQSGGFYTISEGKRQSLGYFEIETVAQE